MALKLRRLQLLGDSIPESGSSLSSTAKSAVKFTTVTGGTGLGLYGVAILGLTLAVIGTLDSVSYLM